jgi:ABC-2 type transport system permease protein
MSEAQVSAVLPPRRVLVLGVLFRALLRLQLSVARLLGIGALGLVAVLLGLFARADDDPAQAAADHAGFFGLGLLVPLATLWLGTSTIGDLVEDRLLVYLWLKPIPRWQVPAAAVLATAVVVIPLTAVPVAVAALVAGAGGVAFAGFVAASLAAVAYSGLFVAAGIWFRRAVWWGLAFVLLWENAAALAVEGTARFTVVGWASAILGTASRIDVAVEAGSAPLAVVVLLAIGVGGWLAATWRYARADVD